jgi:D-sedoheptulose 7-phosphate isomerase
LGVRLIDPVMNQTLVAPVLPSLAEERYYFRYAAAINAALAGVEVTDRQGLALDRDDAIGELCERTRELRRLGRKQFLCGNGASAAMANHMALDWTKNAGVPTVAFSDTALLTAVANDLGGTEIFCAPLRWYGAAGDQLVTISSSGNSPNILLAIAAARELGITVVTFSGLRPDNKCRASGDLNFYVPAKTYGVVECAHQVLLHLCLDRFMEIKEWEKTVEQNMCKAAFRL